MVKRMSNTVSYWKSAYAKDPTGGQYTQKEVATFVSKLLRISNKSSLLDVGCGGGLLLKMLPGKEKVGIDYSKIRIEEAKKNVPGSKFLVGEANNLPFPDKKFDGVLSHSTFLCYDEKYSEEAMRELERVCKKGGIIVIGDVPDITKYKYGGKPGYLIRKALLKALGKSSYTCFDRRFFTDRGYTIKDSPFNTRFYAIKTNGD